MHHAVRANGLAASLLARSGGREGIYVLLFHIPSPPYRCLLPETCSRICVRNWQETCVMYITPQVTLRHRFFRVDLLPSRPRTTPPNRVVSAP